MTYVAITDMTYKIDMRYNYYFNYFFDSGYYCWLTVLQKLFRVIDSRLVLYKFWSAVYYMYQLPGYAVCTTDMKTDTDNSTYSSVGLQQTEAGEALSILHCCRAKHACREMFLLLFKTSNQKNDTRLHCFDK